ncbi:hypothetical protein OHC33_007282 [Knufia fluminis]|uniref:Uncharacterized protein n=1 Tax=Knufia fluminis TaxID=191047 RepID=A0AAN8I4E8_9EURO|nr:hypothetical protein OHC33_007282 [Knufia fluminis]
MVALLRTNAAVFGAIAYLAQLGFAQEGQSYRQLSKGKTVAPAFDFLKNFTFPIPSFAYNVTAKDNDDFDIYWLDQFQARVTEWLQFFRDVNFTDAELNAPVNFVCPTDDEAYFTKNQTCPNASYVTYPYYVVSDLAWYLPQDACAVEDWDNGCASWLNSTLDPVNKTGSLIDELNKQQVIAEQNKTVSYYRLISDYLGVGFPVNDTCRANINMALGSGDEFNKAGMNAATTLMALIPALLTIGNLFVPRSSEVFASSFLVGIMSAMFSLGLPVRSISGVRSDQRADVGTFGFRARYWLARFGKNTYRSRKDEKGQANECFSLSSLQKWSADFDPLQDNSITEELASTDWAFSSIKTRAKEWQQRAHYWQIPSVLIAGSQVVLFLLCIGPLFLSYGTPLLLFDCRTYITSIWLLLAAVISALFRFTMWEKGVHERVKLYALSDLALSNFKLFANSSLQYSHDGSKFAHTESELPPLYPPLLNAIGSAVRRALGSSKHSTTGSRHSLENATAHQVLPGSFGFFDRILHNVRLVFYACKDNYRHPVSFLKAGSAKHSPPDAARRWRPLMILMHLSTDGRNPLVTLFTGLVEGFILILLTAFFAAQYGGNLFVMCYSTAVLLVAITLGRGLGLFYVWHSAHSYGLHVIETQDQDQIRGCLRILCSMNEVLVYVNGSWFFEGHRLDVRPRWTAFQLCYNHGHMDSLADNRRCTCDWASPASSPSLLPVSKANVVCTSKPLPHEPITRITSVSSISGNTNRKFPDASGWTHAISTSSAISPILPPPLPSRNLGNP